MAATLPLVGRAGELAQALNLLQAGSNVLITGRAGIGKSAFLMALAQELPPDRPLFRLPSGNLKQALLELARQIHEGPGLRLPRAWIPERWQAKATRQQNLPWRHLARTLGRVPSAELMPVILASIQGQHVLLLIDSLEVPPNQAAFLEQLLEVAQVAAAMQDSNRRQRIHKLLWRFPEKGRIALRPLPADACKALAKSWLAAHPLRFADPQTQSAFLQAIAQDSGGIPAAILGMLEAAASEPEITRPKVRAFAHEAGVQYLDMTPALVVLLVATIAGRYIARGIGSNELYILTGVGIAILFGVRYFVGRLQ